MKIALIRKDYFLSRGGGERYAVNLSQGLTKLGHEVHVFAHQWDKIINPAIIFHKVPTLTLFSSLKNLSFAYNCRKVLARENFDIIHSLSQSYSQDVYRMGDGIHRYWLRIQTPNSFCRFLKTLTPRQQTILYLEKQTFHPSNYMMIICNSCLSKKHAIHYYQVPQERIRVVYNGVDHSYFHPKQRERYNEEVRKKLQISKKDFVILFVARNFDRKGLGCLIKALPLIQKGGKFLKVLVVGKGNPVPYRKIATQAGCGKQLFFAGETDNIVQFYGVGDILVLPTHYDPFSNVCLEALACGIPVVTTKENGVAEIIKPGETGVVISDPSSREELAAGISRFFFSGVKDSDRMKAVNSVKKFTIEENTRQTLKVYHRVLLMKKQLKKIF